MRNNTPQQLHQPVLLKEVLSVLSPHKGENYLDLTAGYGGHALEVIGMIGGASLATLVDRDSNAIQQLQPLQQAGARLLHTDFLSAAKLLVEEGKQFDMLLIDLGVSSPQLDIAERGFSFRESGPLDMRMDNRETFTAADIVNKYPVDELTRIIHVYGEEPYKQARRIAQAIIAGRPLRTTEELAMLIERNNRGPRGKRHPATRTFQSLRIAVNQELKLLEELLPLIPRLLSPGGRVAIISFHSLEDRLVKNFFKEQADAGYEADLKLITKKPITAAHTETVSNPRARSAKLRAAAKIKI